MKKYLMLEDRPERTPQLIADYINPPELGVMYRTNNWIIVRNFQEFTDWILKNGLPDVISFDHDLADEHYSYDQKTDFLTLEEYYDSGDREMTGYDCAKWLVEFCMYEKLSLPEYYIHSMNPVGGENIKKYLENYKQNR